MAQTTNFFGNVSGSPRLYYNTTGGSALTDMSGELVSFTPPDNERGAGGVHTVDGDQALIAAGKIAPGAGTIRAVYAPGSAGVWNDLNAAYQNGTPIYLFWFPAGSATGRVRYASGAASAGGSANNGGCIVQKRPAPVTNADEAGVFTYEVPVFCPGFTGAIL